MYQALQHMPPDLLWRLIDMLNTQLSSMQVVEVMDLPPEKKLERLFEQIKGTRDHIQREVQRHYVDGPKVNGVVFPQAVTIPWNGTYEHDAAAKKQLREDYTLAALYEYHAAHRDDATTR